MRFEKIKDGFTHKGVSILMRERSGTTKEEEVFIVIDGEVRVTLEDSNYGTKKVFGMVKDDAIFIDPRTIYTIKFVKESKVIRVANGWK